MFFWPVETRISNVECFAYAMGMISVKIGSLEGVVYKIEVNWGGICFTEGT